MVPIIVDGPLILPQGNKVTSYLIFLPVAHAQNLIRLVHLHYNTRKTRFFGFKPYLILAKIFFRNFRLRGVFSIPCGQLECYDFYFNYYFIENYFSKINRFGKNRRLTLQNDNSCLTQIGFSS